MKGYDNTWKEAFLGMATALRVAGVAEWWPSEGTLISLLRYGMAVDKLPGGQSDVAAGTDFTSISLMKHILIRFNHFASF